MGKPLAHCCANEIQNVLLCQGPGSWQPQQHHQPLCGIHLHSSTSMCAMVAGGGLTYTRAPSLTLKALEQGTQVSLAPVQKADVLRLQYDRLCCAVYTSLVDQTENTFTCCSMEATAGILPQQYSSHNNRLYGNLKLRTLARHVPTHLLWCHHHLCTADN